jgi:hypothetical protein
MLGALVNDNRRSAYRVRPIETDRLRLILKWRDTRYEPFEVGDVTRHGASVRFPKGVGPGVRKGDEVAVEIESPNLHGGATIAARVVFSGDSTTERMLGLAFDDAEGLDARATESFFQLFNRRVAYRDSQSNPSTPLPATVKPLATAAQNNLLFPVTVRNLSATGICLDVGEEADRFMVERGDIRVSLTLPGIQQPCDIITTVCYRSVIAGKIYYGCHFDWPATPRAQAILEALTNYTTERFEQEIASLSG